MATTIDTPRPESTRPSPDARPPGESRRRLGGRRRAWLLGAAVVTAAAAVVAVVALTVGGDDDPAPLTGVNSGLIEHGSIRAIEGSVEDTVDAPARGVDRALAAQTARLEGEARRYEQAASDGDPEPARADQVEQLERQAHLDGQAATYGDREPVTALNPNGPGAPASEHSVDRAGG